MMVYDCFESEWIGTLTLAGDAEGLRHIFFQQEEMPAGVQGCKRDTTFFKQAKAQLRAYFNGELKQFDLELMPVGTPFQLKVWQALRSIPYGTVVSYKTVAEAIGNPAAVRAVGGANAKNPIPVVVPCHRVIGSNGTLVGFGGGLKIKQRLIELENRSV